MPTSGLTFAIATWGAVFGTISASAAVWNAARDRPRIRVHGTNVSTADAAPSVKLTVENIGHRATTVRSVGFYAHRSRVKVIAGEDDASPGSVRFETEAEVACSVAESIFLEPGQSQTFDATRAVLASRTWIDEPWRAYAVDIRGRRIWGPAARIARIMIGSNPPLEGAPQELIDFVEKPTPEKFRYPAQVEPTWKVWKSRELRRPKRWSGG